MRKKLEGFFQIGIVILSFIMIILVVLALKAYDEASEQTIQGTAVNGFSQLSQETSMQAASYFDYQNQNLKTMANMIENMGLSEETILSVFDNTSNLTGSFVLISLESYTGYSTGEVVEDASGDSQVITKDVDYSGIAPIVTACEEASELVEDEASYYHITEPFFLSEDASYHVALYQRVTYGEKEYVLFYIMDFESVMESVIEKGSNVRGESFLVNADDDLTLLYADDEELSEASFADYMAAEFGEDALNTLTEAIQQSEAGNIMTKDSDGNDVYFIYDLVNLNGGKQWIYICRIDSSMMSAMREGADTIANMRQNKSMVVMMVAPLIFVLLLTLLLSAMLSSRKKKMELLNEELQRANRAQNIFISNMSHEIRTPINAVLGMDEMILRESTEEEILNYARDIQSAGNTLLGLINDILDFTKIEAGKLDIILSEYETGAMVHDLETLLSRRMTDKGLAFIIEVAEDLPRKLYGDELRLKQVMMNILTNAAKYTEEGSVTFRICEDATKPRSKDGIYLRITVTDTGIGMKEEELDKLCKPFERLDEVRNRTIEGAGLGMSIVKSLLEQMASKLEVQSIYGQGSTFAFTIEQKIVDQTPLGNYRLQYKENQAISEKTEGELHASKARILVVDDTPVNLTVVKGLLKRTGIQVDTAESGEECISLEMQNDYDLILLDHRMPGMDGVETLQRLRAEGKTEVPVIALTANVIAGAKDFYLKEGFTDFLSKPVNGRKLERMLLKYLPEETLDTAEELKTRIDEAEAIKISGSQELYEQVCRDFLSNIAYNIEEIEQLWESRDIKNLTIKVHALKSAARLVGAMHVSELAKHLEDCGNEGNVEELEGKLEGLLSDTRKIQEKLTEKLCICEANDLPEIAPEELLEILGAMKEFVTVYDFDQLDFCISQLKNFGMPQEKREAMKKLCNAVAAVDAEEITKILEELMKHE